MLIFTLAQSLLVAARQQLKVNMNGDDVDSLFSAMDDKEMFV
jgi:hypothetical protein